MTVRHSALLVAAVTLLATSGCGSETTDAEPVAAATTAPPQTTSSTPTQVSEEPTPEDTASESAEPVEEDSSPAAAPQQSDGWTPGGLPWSFKFTTDEGWSYKVTLTQMPSLRAWKEVADSPPGKAELRFAKQGDLAGSITSLDEGRNAPPVYVGNLTYSQPMPGAFADDGFPEVEAAGEGVGSPPECGSLTLAPSPTVLACSRLGAIWTDGAPVIVVADSGEYPEEDEDLVDAAVEQLNGPFDTVVIRVSVQTADTRYSRDLCFNAKTGKQATDC